MKIKRHTGDGGKGSDAEEPGAIRVVECRADDIPDGKHADFYRAVLAKLARLVATWHIRNLNMRNAVHTDFA